MRSSTGCARAPVAVEVVRPVGARAQTGTHAVGSAMPLRMRSAKPGTRPSRPKDMWGWRSVPSTPSHSYHQTSFLSHPSSLPHCLCHPCSSPASHPYATGFSGRALMRSVDGDGRSAGDAERPQASGARRRPALSPVSAGADDDGVHRPGLHQPGAAPRQLRGGAALRQLGAAGRRCGHDDHGRHGGQDGTAARSHGGRRRCGVAADLHRRHGRRCRHVRHSG